MLNDLTEDCDLLVTEEVLLEDVDPIDFFAVPL
jgi:hypothetical protein